MMSGPGYFGATGEFPDGELGPGDEGELSFGITADQGNVILIFGKQVEWLGMPPDVARALAEKLIEKADEIDSRP